MKDWECALMMSTLYVVCMKQILGINVPVGKGNDKHFTDDHTIVNAGTNHSSAVGFPVGNDLKM